MNDEYRKEALRIAMRFAVVAGPCANAIEEALRSTASKSEKDARDMAYKECALIVSAQIGLGKTLEDAYQIIMKQRLIREAK